MAQIKVQDMTCGHCVPAVTEAVQRIAPAAKLQADLPSRTVYVEGEISEEDAKKAIVKAGYTLG